MTKRSKKDRRIKHTVITKEPKKKRWWVLTGNQSAAENLPYTDRTIIFSGCGFHMFKEHHN